MDDKSHFYIGGQKDMEDPVNWNKFVKKWDLKGGTLKA